MGLEPLQAEAEVEVKPWTSHSWHRTATQKQTTIHTFIETYRHSFKLASYSVQLSVSLDYEEAVLSRGNPHRHRENSTQKGSHVGIEPATFPLRGCSS